MKSPGGSKLLALALLGSVLLGVWAQNTNEQEAEEFMKELDARFNYECNLEMQSRWEYIVDVMDPDKEEAANAAAVRYLDFKGDAAVNATQYDYSGFDSIQLYRRFRFISKQGPGALPSAELTEYKTLQAKMETIYSTATICDFYEPTKCDLALEPDLEAILAYSRNWDELRHVWDQWREVTGRLMRDDYIRFVELSNQAAVLDGFNDTGMYWLNGYTVDDREAESFVAANPLDQTQFRQMLETVWNTVSEGLYKKLHAYVRWRLNDAYPGKIDLQGPLPAHILGNMWAQDWVNIADLVMPFPQFPSYDVSDSMVKNGWDIQQMFDSAQDFFTSLNLYPMTPTFWEMSVINQTAWGKVIVCHASAEDFCLGPDGEDWRIKMCTQVNMGHLITVHHEMGHIEYFMAYKNQPHVFRDSANPGFHEAIGDLIALSVSTPSHLENILHLGPETQTTAAPKPNAKYTDDEMKDLNFLTRMALEKISFLPFGYLIDKFRWGVFDGSIPTDQMNAGWWQLRQDLQGVAPPAEPRGEEYFDPGAKYHVPANVPYIRYFVSFIVQFQFHSHLCQVAGYSGPLHLCDIYNNTAAGNVLKGAMKRGFSEPWPIVLENLGGSLDMDPQAIISYFEPLIAFLDEELATAGQCVGWGDDCLPYDTDKELEEDDEAESTEAPITEEQTTEAPTTEAPTTEAPTTEAPTTEAPTTEASTTAAQTTTTEAVQSTTVGATTTAGPGNEAQAAKDIADMDTNVTAAVQIATDKDWAYETDMTEGHRNESIIAWTDANNIFNVGYNDVIAYYNYDQFNDLDLKRQFQLQKNRGTAALPEADLNELSLLIAEMGTTLSTARVCPADNKSCKDNEKLNMVELENMMATSTNYDDLQYYWRRWREESGEKVIDHFKRYITLENKAAVANEFNHTGQMWLNAYTDQEYNMNNFISELAALWNATKPLYKNLHAYVRHKLQQKYSDFSSDDLIPAHILGDMFGQNWENIYEIVKPYPDVNITDISDALETLDFVTNMSTIVQDFFGNIGLWNMTEDFKTKSILEHPTDTNFTTCQPSAWDFYDVYTTDLNPQENGRFRIKMCAGKNQKDFIKMHHLMGHTQYQMSYSIKGVPEMTPEKMPLVFRDGANPGFQEAVGGTMELFASTPSYLSDVADTITAQGSRVDTMVDSLAATQGDINFLMKTALSKVAFLPYAYILDAWRWELFEKNNTIKDFNRLWWKMRIEEQGIAPPEERYPESHFDAASKYDVVMGESYIKYFVATILQFQFHEKMCALEGDTSPIYNCSLSASSVATLSLIDMMAMGRSKGWQEVLGAFLNPGSKGKMSAEAMVAYFTPLNDFLTKYLEDNNLEAGWNSDQLDDYIKNEREEISGTVPIIVGCVLAGMVCVVIVAYFVGNSRQKKKAKAKEEQEKKTGFENIEMGSDKEGNEKF